MHFGNEGVNPLFALLGYGRQPRCTHWASVGGVAKENKVVKSDNLKPHKQRGPRSRVKSWLIRPRTILVAIAILRLIARLVKVFDLF